MIIEIAVVILLMATCSYCYILSVRLRRLREGQSELLTLIKKFDDASLRAERNLALMQKTGLTAGKDLDVVTARAHKLMDELSVMVSAGDHVAGRIEGVVNEVRAIGARRPNDHARSVS